MDMIYGKLVQAEEEEWKWMKHTYFADLPTDSNYLQRKQRTGIIRFGPQIKHTLRLQQQVNKHEKIQSAGNHFLLRWWMSAEDSSACLDTYAGKERHKVFRELRIKISFCAADAGLGAAR